MPSSVWLSVGSAPVQHALKKQIAVQKANKGKIERKLKAGP